MESKKSLLQKPESITNILFGIGGLYLLYKFLPNIITLLENTLYAGIMLVALASFIYILLDGKFRAFLYYLYSYSIRKLTGWFITLDPIEIAKVYLRKLRKQQEMLLERLKDLTGQIGKLENTIANNDSEIDSSLSRAKAAKEQANKTQLVINSRKAGRRTASNVELKKLYDKLILLKNVIKKISENTQFVIEDTTDQVAQKEIEYTALKNGHSALKSAMNILNGNSDMRLMFDESMEYINNDIGTKLGEMQHFMEMSTTALDSIDLDNAVFLDKGMALLDKLEAEGNKFLLNSGAEEIDIPVSSKQPLPEFNKYFKRK